MRITAGTIVPDRLRDGLTDRAAGAYVGFEGWIRDHNEGREVLRLEYEVYEPLAVKEGEVVIREARERFPILHAECVHREGLLEIGDCAVWVGVTSAHRDEAFAACRYIIDQVKVRLPIWKKEHYVDGHSGWVSCERCAEHGHELR
jgi:molybdopterin synthase catalytic subunit